MLNAFVSMNYENNKLMIQLRKINKNKNKKRRRHLLVLLGRIHVSSDTRGLRLRGPAQCARWFVDGDYFDHPTQEVLFLLSE
jgi:hypothetical protein